MTRSLQSELVQKTPFEHPEVELFLSLVRATDALCRQPSQILKKAGLSGPQYNVLRILRGAGAAGLPCGDIGARMVTHDSDITRLLNRLESKKWVKRAKKSNDRRCITTHITATGLALLKSLDEPITQTHLHQLGFLPENEMHKILDCLARIREHLSA